MKSTPKAKTKKENASSQLQQLCANLKDNFFTTDILLTISGKDGDPDQKFWGMLFVSKVPVAEKPTTTQN